MGAICIGDHFGVQANDIKEAIESYAPDNNRSQRIEQNGASIILDAYNANPMSMKAGIEFIAGLENSSKVLMLGAMMELGTDSQKEHQAIVDLAQQHNWKQVVLVGREFSQTEHNYIHFETSTKAKSWFNEHISKGDLVYIKGSRLTAMEQIIEND